MATKAYIFIDNSNVFIQAKKTVAELEDAGTWDEQHSVRQLNNCRVDYGCLVRTLLRDRQLGASPVLIGSRPPANDTLWDSMRKQGIDVTVYDRNAANKEKCVDTTIVMSATKTLYTQEPGVIVLVAGDGDYEPLITGITAERSKGWSVEVHFWKSGLWSPTFVDLSSDHWVDDSIENNALPHCGAGLSASMHRFFHPIDDMYKAFTYAVGAGISKRRFIVEAFGNDVPTTTNEEVLRVVQRVEPTVFGWWSWDNDACKLTAYTRSADDQQRLMAAFEETFPTWELSAWMTR